MSGVKPDREAVARAIYDDAGFHSADSWDADHDGVRNHYRGYADTVLALWPGRTEAEVKAEALREAAASEMPDHVQAFATRADRAEIADWLITRADAIERGDQP